MPLSKSQLRNRIITRLRKMKGELEQTITDLDWWNANRDDAEPFDMGFERSLLHCVCKQLDAWEAGDMDAMNRWHDRMLDVAATQGE